MNNSVITILNNSKMNATQRQNILDAIDEFRKTDFDTPFQNNYKDAATTDNVVVADYSISELLAIARRAISQLDNILENGDWQILPSDNVPVASYGSLTLRTAIQNIRTYLSSANYESAASQIKALVYYEMKCGFWDQPKRIDLGIREFSLKKLEEKAHLTMAHTEVREAKVMSLIDELEKKKEEITDLISSKRKELEALKNNQAESTAILTNIKGTENSATSTKEIIESLNSKANNIVTSLKSIQEHYQKQIEENDGIISQAKESLSTFNADASSKLAQITSDYDSVSSNADQVRKMMGYIADGTLSHSFNKRKEDLKKQIYIWLVISIVTVVGAIGWVYVVFTCLSAETGYEWADIIINGIKSSPLFLMLGFSLAQYQKERNLLEEYAFRESVAVTLTAYLEQMPEKEDEDKRKMLISTVEQLYTKPVIANKEYELLKVDTKDISESAKTLKDIIATLVNRK